ncbi:hypothetical protein MON38_08370 [Hymenobacter sp. DH14]|uniref:DUF3298 domain-containing protein n=1 Tax=Hymenobacter cyanobacteriorum TaxID=2926463 RepID=A0A9X2AGA8_9BACT|nr:hypothetical protein [Hymenobacter cyanobacteriorum]MCI1187433.1 hypothetical protein [Hymenobacter cyanobacteriorum]
MTLPVTRRVLLFGCCLSGLVASWGRPAAAQTPAPGRAETYAVLGAGKGAQFSVPQVRLADEAVSQRINRAIARAVVSQAKVAVDTTAALPKQLRQVASDDCCLTGARFQVLLNQGALFSVKISLEFRGASSYERQRYLVFDLGTGERLPLTALLADPPAQLARRLEAAVNRRMGEFLADSATRTHPGRAALARSLHWNATTRQVDFAAGAPAVSLQEFALTPHALLLLYPTDQQAVALADIPEETYRFPYARLQARGRLAELVQKSAAGAR